MGIVGVYRNSYQAEGYQFRTASGVSADVAVSDSSGALRLGRAGHSVTAYYSNGGGFVSLGTAQTNAVDTGFNLDFSSPLTTSPAKYRHRVR
ncbi:MAG: hypothetical protein ABI165_16325 [Bryobacteraceae bacterium]